MCYNIQGILRWPDKDLRKMFTDESGNHPPAKLIRDQLKLWLNEGRRVMPLGECEGFSYQTGCPGHEEVKNA
jgi:hypothetical protein